MFSSSRFGASSSKGKGKERENTKMPAVPCPQCKVLGFTGDCVVCGYNRGSPGPSRAETQSFVNPRTAPPTGPPLRFVERAHLKEQRIPMEPIDNMVEVDLESQAGTDSITELSRRSWWARTKDNVRAERGHIIVGCLLAVSLIIIMGVLQVKYGHERAPATSVTGTTMGKWVVPGVWNGTS